MGAAGVAAPGAIPGATAATLEALAGRAGVIFAGQVAEVRRNDDGGYVDVVFHVDTAVRGCGHASTYVLREWAGLWIGREDRYIVGQKLLMLLAARGPSGVSAPVGGMAGRIPLAGTRMPPLARGTGVAPADTAAEDAGEEAVDLRWVQALSVRGVSLQSSAAVRADWRGPVLPLPGRRTVVSVGPSLSAVIELLERSDGR
jgi:hypothetical protein